MAALGGFTPQLGVDSPSAAFAQESQHNPPHANPASPDLSPTAPAPHAIESAHNDSADSGHHDPFPGILLGAAVVIVAAMVGRWASEKLGQPPVLGELIIGILIGNIGVWMGHPESYLVMHLDSARPIIGALFEGSMTLEQAAASLLPGENGQLSAHAAELLRIITSDHGSGYLVLLMGLWIFSNLGVVLLLFMVGLESSVDEMLTVGVRAFLVAVVGIAAPFAAGYLVGMWLMPEASMAAHLFVGATLTATSVGITARVFKDLGKIQTREAKIILGAAVIDDVLGLIILAVMVGMARTGQIDVVNVGKILGLSALFLGAAMIFGDAIVKRLALLFRAMDRKNYILIFPISFCFLLSYVAGAIGLAAIVGAFAAGLVINRDDFRDDESGLSAEKMVASLEKLFAPVFFVFVGMQVNLETFADSTTLMVGGALTVVAVLGKIISGVAAGKGVSRLAVGIGMVPRGEVGLIFASAGKSVGVVTDWEFSAIVLMIVLTTILTPPALKWSLAGVRPAD